MELVCAQLQLQRQKNLWTFGISLMTSLFPSTISKKDLTRLVECVVNRVKRTKKKLMHICLHTQVRFISVKAECVPHRHMMLSYDHLIP